jgi:signal transduction histidine kinase
MFTSFLKNISRGFAFIRENPQILYTVFLLVVIPLAFIFTGQKFLDVAQTNQERIEKERVGLMQDVFVSSVRTADFSDGQDHTFLQNIVDDISKQNPTIVQLRVLLRKTGGGNVVVASLDKSEIGKEDTLNKKLYETSGLKLDDSLIFEVMDNNGDRHWKAVRAILDENREVKGWMLTDISMVYIDEVTKKNVREAYSILLFIILAIFLLLMRQAKVVDYAVLYKKLKEVDKMKDDFVSMAAHELKTPLTAIKGYVGLVSTDNLSPDDKESISRVNISVDRLNALIGDILDVSRIQQGRIKMSFKKTDPSEVIQSVIDSFNVIANEKNLTLEYDKRTLPEILVDPKRLEQVLINILGNALKYTPKGGVKITAVEEKSVKKSILHIRVSDTGLGISAEDQRKLFKRFSRIRTAETADIGGTGLGLWISAQMVHAMGGKIAVESIEGKGSDFIISFPVVK